MAPLEQGAAEAHGKPVEVIHDERVSITCPSHHRTPFGAFVHEDDVDAARLARGLKGGSSQRLARAASSLREHTPRTVLPPKRSERRDQFAYLPAHAGDDDR